MKNNHINYTLFLEMERVNSIIHDCLIDPSKIECNMASRFLKIVIYVRLVNSKELIYKNIFKKVYLVPMAINELTFYNFKNINIKDNANIDIYFCNHLKYKKGKFILYAEPDLKIYVYGNNTQFRFISNDNIIGYTELTRLNFLPIEKLGIEIFQKKAI